MSYNDVFKEQLISRKKNIKDYLMITGLIIIGIVLFVLVSLLLPSFSIPVIAIIIWIEIILIRRFNVEYEYILTNNELDIDKIMNRNGRKHVRTFNIKNFHVVIPINSPSFKSEVGNINKVLDYGKGVITETSYAAVIEEEGKRIQLTFDPNETLLKAMKMYIPRKIK